MRDERTARRPRHLGAHRRIFSVGARALAAAHLLAGCVFPDFAAGQFLCTPGDRDSCPEGSTCHPDGVCREPCPGGVCRPCAVAVAAGNNHTCALGSDDIVYCWGNNDHGQLGDGSTIDSVSPVPAEALGGGVVHIATGRDHTCAVKDDGSLWCWGRNDAGQLGPGPFGARTFPVPVTDIGSEVARVAAGSNHTCALRNDGSVLCWGKNGSGQLGDGTFDPTFKLAEVAALGGTVSQVAAGPFHTCATTTIDATDATFVLCWGKNESGQLGNGSVASAASPVPIDVSHAAEVAAGGADYQGHSCARVLDGGVYCWGNNDHGQVAWGPAGGNVLEPRKVVLEGAAQVATGGFHTCARDATGTLHCWGSGDEGQIGTAGAIADNPSPLQVETLGTDVAVVATGGRHTCAIATGGQLYCWGANYDGQLGDGTAVSRSTPVRLVDFCH